MSDSWRLEALRAINRKSKDSKPRNKKKNTTTELSNKAILAKLTKLTNEASRKKRSADDIGTSRNKLAKASPAVRETPACNFRSVEWDSIQTTTSLPRSDESATFEFPFRGDGDEFIHPLMFLTFQFQVLRENGDKLEEKIIAGSDGQGIVEMDKVTPINFFQNTLWSRVSVSINDTMITPQDNVHPFLAYKRLLEDFTETFRNNALEMAFYTKPETTNLQETDPTSLAATESFKSRTAWVKQSRVCEVSGPLLINGLNHENQWLPPGVHVKVSLQRMPTAFALMAPESNTTKYKITILEAELKILRMRPTAEVSAKFNQMLNSQGFSSIPICQNETRIFSITTGSNKINQVCWDGRLPTVVTVMMLDTSGFNGVYHRNGLDFEDFGLKSICFEVNGRQIPSKPIKVDIANNQYTQLYINYILSRNDPNDMLRNVEIPFSYEEYPNGYCFMSFRISPGPSDFNTPPEIGVLRLCMEFASALSKDITVLVIGEMERTVLVCKDRSVHVIPSDEQSLADFRKRLKEKSRA